MGCINCYIKFVYWVNLLQTDMRTYINAYIQASTDLRLSIKDLTSTCHAHTIMYLTLRWLATNYLPCWIAPSFTYTTCIIILTLKFVYRRYVFLSQGPAWKIRKRAHMQKLPYVLCQQSSKTNLVRPLAITKFLRCEISNLVPRLPKMVMRLNWIFPFKFTPSIPNVFR